MEKLLPRPGLWSLGASAIRGSAWCGLGPRLGAGAGGRACTLELALCKLPRPGPPGRSCAWFFSLEKIFFSHVGGLQFQGLQTLVAFGSFCSVDCLCLCVRLVKGKPEAILAALTHLTSHAALLVWRCRPQRPPCQWQSPGHQLWGGGPRAAPPPGGARWQCDAVSLPSPCPTFQDSCSFTLRTLLFTGNNRKPPCRDTMHRASRRCSRTPRRRHPRLRLQGRRAER